MKSFSAINLKSILVAIVLGTVMTDPNLVEFCSKEYFDRIITTKTIDNRNVIELYRKDETKNESNHKWSAYLLDNQNISYFKLSEISYELNGRVQIV